MNISGFTTESLDTIQQMLYAEGQVNPLAGECEQKAKREAAAKPRTPAQEAADQARSQQQRGKAQGSPATRSEAAKKAAETRKRCKGGGSTTGTTAGPTT
jgi:hypothetical protein